MATPAAQGLESRLHVRARLGWAFVLVALVLLALLVWTRAQMGSQPADAITYLAAGERLNAGHALYALQAGDRPIINWAPYWTVPLLSPPPIAVLWRPLAALPGELGVPAWLLFTGACVAIPLGLAGRRRSLVVGIALLVFDLPLSFQLMVGNVDGALLGAAFLAWFLFLGRRPGPLGALAAVMVAIKLTPLVLAIWALAALRPVDRPRYLAWFVGTGVAVLGVSLLGAGLAAHLDYLGIAARTATSGASPFSVGGLAQAAGLSRSIAAYLPDLVFLPGLVGAVVLRHRPALSFAVAILAMTLGTPALYPNTLVIPLAVLAPLVWPDASSQPMVVEVGDRMSSRGTSPA